MKKHVYLGGPIEGLKWSEAFEWREKAEIFLKDAGIEVYNPVIHVPESFRVSNEIITSQKIINFLLANSINSTDFGAKVFFQDFFHLQECDICLFNLGSLQFPGGIQGIGTFWEIGASFVLRKLRIAFNSLSIFKEHPFIANSININFDSLDEALDYIVRL